MAAELNALAALGYRPDGEEFTDPGQGIRGRFVTGPGPRIEVLTQIDGSRVLEPWLAKGAKLYHQAYEVQDLDSAIERHTRAGAVVVSKPVPAVAFGGRRVSFLMLPTMFLVELIEAT